MKKLLLFITSIITVVTLTACSSSNTKNKLQEVKEKNKIVLGVSPDYPPYEFLTTEERKKAVDFSDVYYTSKGIFVVNKDSEEIKSVADLKNKKIGVQKGSTYETYAKEQLKMDDKNIQALTDVPSLLQDLKNKKIDAVLIPDDVAKIAMNKYTDIKISTFTADNDPEATGMAIAFKKGKNYSNKELLEQVNAVIKEIQDQKAFEKELDKYAKVAAQSE